MLIYDTREHSHHGIKHVAKPFDWSFSTDYKGSMTPGSKPFEPSSTPIPIELLKRPDPILFFDDVMLYEDELADNGISMLSCKIRVMPSRLLLLCRLFMRLDNVVIRLRDTRVYVDFGTREVIREYQAKEEQYEKARQVRRDPPNLLLTNRPIRLYDSNSGQILATSREDAHAAMRDPNKLTEILPVVDHSLERVVVGRE
jgi:type 2A phosphatase activator TIP41